jgi:hypothetical protein
MAGLSIDGSVWDIFGSAANVGADPSYDTPRSTATVPTDAVGSMTPVTVANDSGGWSDFWKGTLQTVIGYSIAKDAAQSGIAPRTGSSGQPVYTATQQPVQRAGLQLGPLLIGAAVVAGVVLVAKLAK